MTLRVGLTGGIAAGKSVVAARLAELGAQVVDYDVLAREVVAVGSAGLPAVVEVLGGDVLAPDGSLDRAAVARLVFADPEARARLNAVVHPLVREAAAHEEARARAAGASVVVHDIPLLVESGRSDDFDEVLVVDAPPELRIRRLVEGRGLAPEEAAARVAAQADDDDRRAAATVVLDGSGSADGLREQVDRWWEQARRR